MSNTEQKLKELASEVKQFLHSDSERALEIAEDLLDLATKSDSLEYIALANYNIANSLFNLRDLSKSLEFFSRAKKYYIELENPKSLISCIVSQGVIYRQQGNYSKALKLYTEAMKITDKLNYPNPIIYNNIATIYFKQKKFIESLKYFKIALKQNHELENKKTSSIITVMLNIGNIYFELKKLAKAKNFYEEAYKLGEKTNNIIPSIPALRGLGRISKENGNYEDALSYFEDGLVICEKSNYNIETIMISLVMADVLKHFGRYEDITKLLKNSLYVAVNSEQDLVEECLEKLVEHYEDILDYENAYKTSKELSKVKEQIFTAQRERKLAEVQAQFETREKDKLLNQERAFNQKLEQQNKELKRLNTELEQFNYAVSHDLKEPIRSVQSYAQMLVMHTEERMSPQEWKAINDMDDNVRRMNEMVTDLMKYALLGNKEMEAVPVDLNEVLAIVESSLQLKIKETNAKIIKSELPSVRGYKTLLVQLFQNLIQNALKFTREGIQPEISVIATEKEDKVIIKVRDNGCGIPEDQQQRVFRMFTRLDKTSKIEGSGIGLSMCQKIAKKMQGSLNLASDGKTFTEFTISLISK